MIRRALLSVSDKSGIIDVAKRLTAKGIEILSTGGTAKALAEAGIAVTPVEDVTKFPECFSGRVKTLHPLLLGGVLFKRSAHKAEAEKLGMTPIDLVIVNLYPFSETVQKGAPEEAIIENIDIGGPTLLRSAAKNAEAVTVVCNPLDYERVLHELEARGDTTLALRRELATKAFLHTAQYDAAITAYLSQGKNLGVFFTGGKDLRYGENPHQWGKVYERPARPADGRIGRAISGQRSVGGFSVLQGKEMSYLNYLDADEAWKCVREFSEPTAVFLKHASPCGVASNGNILDAFRRGYDADPRSAFGVIIALNRECTEDIVREILDRKIFTEILLAPGFSAGARTLLTEKPNIRVLHVPSEEVAADPELRSITGGVLVQAPDQKVVSEADITVVTKKKPSSEQLRDLLFAWKVVKHVKSNAIVFAKDRVTVGIGPGQTSRVDAAEIASRKAGERAKGAVMASDAFFPFSDAVEEAARSGISAIIQPGGSMRDSEVFAKADELGIAMVTTGVRAFRH